MIRTRFRVVQRDKNFYIVHVTSRKAPGYETVTYEVTTTSDGDVLLANCEDQALGDAIVTLVTELVRLG